MEEEEEEEEWCLAHASNIFSSIKKNKTKKNRVGWQQFWEVSITPCCNKALIWALDNVSAPCLCNTLNLAHLAFLWFAVLRDTPLVTFLSFFLSQCHSELFSSVSFLSLHHPAYNVLKKRNLSIVRSLGRIER